MTVVFLNIIMNVDTPGVLRSVSSVMVLKRNPQISATVKASDHVMQVSPDGTPTCDNLWQSWSQIYTPKQIKIEHD